MAVAGAPSGGRDRSLDAMRGFAILSVVLGHTMAKMTVTQGQTVSNVVLFVLYLYNVQLFAFVSGYLLKRFDFAHGVRTLLVPFLGGVVLASVVLGDDFIAALPAQLVAGLGGSGMWFLWALFLSYCLFGLVRSRWLLVALALITAATWSMFPTLKLGAPYQLADVVAPLRTLGLVLPYMVFGALWRRWESRGLVLTGAIAGIAFVAFMLGAGSLLAMQTFFAATTRGGAVALTVTYWTLHGMCGCLGCIAALWASRRLKGFVLAFLGFFGMISIGLYQFHPLLIAKFLTFFTTQSWTELMLKTALLVFVSVSLTLLVGMNQLTSAVLLGGRSWPIRTWRSLFVPALGERE